MSVVRVGLLGLGTVGTGVVKTIRSQEKKLTQRLGKKVEIVKALVRDVTKTRQVEVEAGLLTDQFSDVLDSNIEILVEVMGGVEPTFQYITEAISQGCHVVTANKELLAKRGKELIQLANRHQVHLAYEASVAGGIPILGVLRQFLRTNEIEAVQGIVNGTTNYILTQMEAHQRSYVDVLQEAQELGYAEMDPTSDVEGYDALYKLCILSQLVFGEAPALENVTREGISRLTLSQIQFAKELGYRVKLLARASKSGSGVTLSVRPTLLSLGHPLAAIEDAYNAVQVTGNIVGELLFTGKGAGELPTASAVVEDLAYLLTQPFLPQPEWTVQVSETGCTSGLPASASDRQFVYLEAEAPEIAPYQIFDRLQDYGVRVSKQKTQFSAGEVIRIGLVAEGFEPQHAAALQTSFPVKISSFPILEKGTQGAETKRSASDEQKQFVISQLV